MSSFQIGNSQVEHKAMGGFIMRHTSRVFSVVTAVAMVFLGVVFAPFAQAAKPAVIVLDPDDDVARVTWPDDGLVIWEGLGVSVCGGVW
jgi:hypothetical protein